MAAINNDSTDTEVGAADMAITTARDAIKAATNVPQHERDANTETVDTLAAGLTRAKMARQTAMNDAQTAMDKAMVATGKALRAALGPNQGGTTALTNIAAPTLSSAGLEVDAAADAGALPDTGAGSDPDAVTLKAGASAGSLDGWMGTDYALSSGTGASKVTNEARVYTNRGAAKSQPFVEKYGDDDTYTASTRTYNVGETADSKINASAFPTKTNPGTKTFTGAQDLPGEYDGASGRYKCDAAETCTAQYTANGIVLSADWEFVHEAGASISTPDPTYLYYGWWVSKDKDGDPTAASAFAGVVAADQDARDTLRSVAGSAIVSGSATYEGKAAGKFAISNPLDGTGNGGHFTADAMLTAKFGAVEAPNNGGMTGTIDNFRLNDGSEDPGWSVSLARGAWAANGAIAAPATNPTVWSINGNKAPASGTWSGQMYDEMPGNAPAGDGSDLPTTVTGTFYSEFSAIGRMVGAFGANKQ